MAALAVLGLGAASAPAQPDRAAASSGKKAPRAENAVGEYSGVDPGEAAPPRGLRHRGKRPTITWIGFVPRSPGAARVFVQLTRQTSFDQKVEKGALVVTIDGAHLLERNTGRPLDTRFFDTPLARVVPKRFHRHHHSGVELTLAFKTPADAAQAQAHMDTGKDGMTYLFLDVGGGGGEVAPGSDDAGG